MLKQTAAEAAGTLLDTILRTRIQPAAVRYVLYRLAPYQLQQKTLLAKNTTTKQPYNYIAVRYR